MADKQDRRGFFLPLARDEKTGQFRLAMPRIMDEIASAFSLPGDVYQGKVDPLSDESIGRAVGLAGLVSGGPVVGAARDAAGRAAVREGMEAGGNMFAKGPMEYDPPKYPQRPFRADYPGEVETDAAGKLLRSIDGSPLEGRYIAGRTSALRPDQPLGPDDLAGVGERLLGKEAERVPRDAIQASGATEVYERSGEPSGILLADDLHPDDVPRVLGHETGHVIDQLAGTIPADGLTDELVRNYDSLATGKRWSPVPKTPQDLGYPEAEAPRELMVEAIRAYMADPNYLKTVAPKTAARIRASVNDHPRLKDTIQFNALAPLAVGGLGGVLADQQMRRPPEPGTELQRALARQ